MFRFRRSERPREGPPASFTLVWLVYMAFPLYTLFHRPLEERLIGLGFVAIFAFIYVLSYRQESGRLTLVMVQIAFVALACFRYDENFLYMAFYPAPVIGLLKSRRDMLFSMSVLLLLYGSVFQYYSLFSDSEKMLQLLPAVLVMFSMPVAMRLGRRSRELRERLSDANEEIARLTRQEERQRISRDLHDTLGHTLSLITLKSELAEKLIAKNPERAVQEVRDIQSTSRAALKQVRELVAQMNAVTLESEVASAARILEAAGIELRTEGEVGARAGSPIIDNLLGMCLREAVTNVVKHSRARSCVIALQEEADKTVLTIEDDGVGMPEAAGRVPVAPGQGGSGLQGMRDRLRLIEGSIRYESGAEGKGTRMSITAPKVAKSVAVERSASGR
ncbi:sensor histidine kinase [Paenibacillus aurantiacus]|uniref:histidine kinase n=1 Tax=Paenibacillus aurantiacus TaxID=1936118 RepID=A0ABV5KL02_9BACL